MREDLITALGLKGIELLPAELQQCIPLLIAEIIGPDQAVDASGMGRDAVTRPTIRFTRSE